MSLRASSAKTSWALSEERRGTKGAQSLTGFYHCQQESAQNKGQLPDLEIWRKQKTEKKKEWGLEGGGGTHRYKAYKNGECGLYEKHKQMKQTAKICRNPVTATVFWKKKWDAVTVRNKSRFIFQG